MPLPASLIASVISAIIEAAVQNPSPDSQPDSARYQVYATNRTLPPEAKTGVMVPPTGDGQLIIDGTSYPIAATAQFRSPQNLLVMPMSIQGNKDVVYLTNASGSVYRVWMLSPTEASALQNN